MKKVVVSVINDLVTDMRVHKMCLTLKDMGYNVHLVGRVLPSSPKMDNRPYSFKRMRLLFTSGPFFYACFNLRLFLLLLFRKSDVFVSNDLDTLLANFLVAKIKGKPLVYDSHEYFTEVPELQGRFARKVWLAIEKMIFPGLKYVITVNESIANAYFEKYGVRPLVVRNLPLKLKESPVPFNKEDLGIDKDDRIIILQGSGINLDRGGEEAVLAVKHLDNVVLLVVGSGDALPELKKIAEREKIRDKVKFIGRQPHDILYRYTAMADIGLSLDKDTNLNYRYSLPNKIFDYLNCGVPVLASDLPEVSKIVEGYDVGLILKQYSVDSVAKAVSTMLEADFKKLKSENIKRAAAELCWENNLDTIQSVYSKFI